MSYFQNPLYIATLMRRQGAEGYFHTKDMASLLIYVEMETRLLIETAIKFMRNARRTKLDTEDIELAALSIGHGDIIFPANLSGPKAPATPIGISELAQRCGFGLSSRIQSAKMKGRVLYKGSKVCYQSSRRPIRQLSSDQLWASKDQLNSGHFNLVLFHEKQFLSVEEANYLTRFQLILLENRYQMVKKLDGKVIRMLSMYLALIRNYPNQAGLKLLDRLITHPHVTKAILSHHLHQVIEVLLVYRGTWAYQVGHFIAELVKEHLQQQPELLRVMEIPNSDYSFVLKAIAFEEHFEVDSLHCRVQQILSSAIQECFKGNQMAILCFRKLIDKSAVLLSYQKQMVRMPYWIPSPWFQNDRYLLSL